MKGDKLNAFMLFRCFCFLRPGGTYNNFFMAPSASWQSGEGAGRSERCHHLKRSLKVYTFLWGWEDRAKERSDDEIGEISFWFIIKTKDFHQHHRDLECIFLLSLREKKFLFFAEGEENIKENIRQWQQNYTSCVVWRERAWSGDERKWIKNNSI